MNSAIFVAISALFAVANAGFIGAPAVGVYSAAPVAYARPVGLTYSTGLVRTAPVVTYAHAPRLVRVARSPGLIGAAPVAYASPVVHSYAAAPVVKSVAYSSPIVHAAPVVYGAHAAPFAYSAGPVAYYG